MKQSNYTKPKVCKAAKGWYVYFYYNGNQKRYKKGINRIKNIYNREIEANALAEALHIKLKSGWNPEVPELVETKNTLTIISALEFSLSKKEETLAPKSYSGYKGTVNFIITAINALAIEKLDIRDLKRAHIRTIVNKAKQQRSWSNKARNKHLNHLKALLSELVQWDILEYNPAHNIANLKVEESRANIPATEKEHEKIKACLSTNHPYFYNFVRTIFHTGIRPKEILNIKLSDINIDSNTISLAANITKTRKSRIVPLNNYMIKMLLEMDLSIYPQEFYLFGSYRKRGRGNVGKYIDFIPGPTQLKRDTATKKWHRIVKKGLNINVSMYSNKHKGADEKIKMGINLDTLRSLYGHTSQRMTEIYTKEIKNVYKNEIINKSPDY